MQDCSRNWNSCFMGVWSGAGCLGKQFYESAKICWRPMWFSPTVWKATRLPINGRFWAVSSPSLAHLEPTEQIIHGGKFQEPTQLNKRASDYLVEFHQAQEQPAIVSRTGTESRWCPPPNSKFKLNFDAAIFSDLRCLGMGAIIQNEKGEVMQSYGSLRYQIKLKSLAGGCAKTFFQLGII